ncbi:uncharacterized protein LOC110737733 isoform X2 [Chenopodium quinoa]|uniref:uncharacterized protein LOC110737733 isoform X2 n=1 Tax=Chenopodium quinoa TaxID=63459 RepID=UPI000B774B04|nr:uncharacterized protein LOC110737733 isoform X2 [Chenopodium quinoa]
MSSRIPKIRSRFSLRIVEKRGTVVSQRKAMTRAESLMAPDMMEGFIKMAGFPETAFSHGKGKKVENYPKGFVVFFKFTFLETGTKFSFKPLTKSFIEILGLSPGQLMPSGWRILSVLEEVTKNWDDPYTLEDLTKAYEIKMRKDGFVSLHKKGEQLVLNIDCNDRGWASWFVFVKKTSLGSEGNWLTEGWPMKGLNFDFLEPTEASTSKVKRILEVKHTKRTFKRTRYILGESLGQNQKGLPSTSQRVEDSEETMSTPQGSRRGRSLSQAE